LKEAAACRTEGHGREWTISALCYGSTWSSSGTIPTDKKFTGQRLDSATGLYYYGARYYAPDIGRFISADTIVPAPANPQAFNRYSYAVNNPLRYTDPTGNCYGPFRDMRNSKVGSAICKKLDRVRDTAVDAGKEVADTVQEEVEEGVEAAEEMYDDLSDVAWEAAEAVDEAARRAADEMKEAGQVTFDVAGQMHAAPNTALGLAAGGLSGGSSRMGPRSTIIYEGVRADSFTGRIMSDVLGRNTFTLGYVIVTAEQQIDPGVLKHELGHVTQYAILGPQFLPVYGGFHVAAGGRHDKNLMETKLLPGPRLFK
jgi:RHS repeat-associated protein